MRTIRSAIMIGVAFAAFLLAQMAPLPAASQSLAQPGPAAAQNTPQGSAADSRPAHTGEAMAADAGFAGQAEGWHAVVVSGIVRYLSTDPAGDVAWGDVAAGDVFSAATQFETGANGHLLLFNGHDSLAVAPSSSVAVPQNASPAAPIRILQDLGTVRYDVESRNPDSAGIGALLVRMLTSDAPPGAVFEVRTPHLAVVVKGTSFTITVTPHETKVVVVEGVVGVSDPLTGDAVDLGAGQSVVRGIVEQAGLVVETISASSNQLISKTTDALADTGLAVEQSLEAVATGLAATLEVPLATTGVESSGGGSSGGGASSGGSSGGGSSGGGSVRDSARDTVSRTRDSVSGALGL